MVLPLVYHQAYSAPLPSSHRFPMGLGHLDQVIARGFRVCCDPESQRSWQHRINFKVWTAANKRWLICSWLVITAVEPNHGCEILQRSSINYFLSRYIYDVFNSSLMDAFNGNCFLQNVWDKIIHVDGILCVAQLLWLENYDVSINILSWIVGRFPTFKVKLMASAK